MNDPTSKRNKKSKAKVTWDQRKKKMERECNCCVHQDVLAGHRPASYQYNNNPMEPNSTLKYIKSRSGGKKKTFVSQARREIRIPPTVVDDTPSIHQKGKGWNGGRKEKGRRAGPISCTHIYTPLMVPRLKRYPFFPIPSHPPSVCATPQKPHSRKLPSHCFFFFFFIYYSIQLLTIPYEERERGKKRRKESEREEERAEEGEKRGVVYAFGINNRWRNIPPAEGTVVAVYTYIYTTTTAAAAATAAAACASPPSYLFPSGAQGKRINM